jgi:hypothetical protein
MGWPRVRVVVVTLVLLVGVTGLIVAAPATAADARLTLTAATVTPGTPAAGAPITVSTTIRLSAGSDTPLALDTVRVDRTDGGETLGRATDLGTLSPGETLSVPVTVTVDEPSVTPLEVVVTGTDQDGDSTRATRPVTVGVEVGAPQFEIGFDELVAGADRPVQVEIANPTTAPLRGIELRLTGPAAADSDTRTVPTLAPGATQTLNVTAGGAQPGAADLAVEANYTDPTGAQRHVTAVRRVEVVPGAVDIGVRAAPTTTDTTQQVPAGIGGLVGGGSLQPQSDESAAAEGVDVTVSNFGNAAVEDVVLTGRTPDGALLASVGRFAVSEALEPGEAETVTIDLSRVRVASGLRFVASYDTPENRSATTLAYDYSAAQGAASVTGLDVTVDEPGNVSIGGNLANTGDGEITGVVVGVQSTEYVEPAYPQRTYFVGTVGASEFAPFDLTARADTENATSVGLSVTYSSGGERRTETVRAPLKTEAPAATEGAISQSMALPLAAVVGLLAVGTAGLVARRRFE